MIAEEDPVGSIIGVKTQDIDITTVAGSGSENLWRISEEVEYIQNAKFKALGISEAMLNGDATYNNMEQALSIFLDKIRTFRDFMTRKIIIEKVLEPIAKAHGFYRKKGKGFKQGAGLVNRYGVNINIHESSDSELILPTIQWSKPLEPRMDQTLIELYRTAEECGLPICLRKVAVAVGTTIEEVVASTEEDLKVRRKLANYIKERNSLKEELEGAEGGEESGMGGGGGSDFGPPSGGGSGGEDFGSEPGGEPGGPEMEPVDEPGPGKSVVDDIPPPPDAQSTLKFPWANHPLRTASGFCGLQNEVIQDLIRLSDADRLEALRNLTVREKAAAKYALSYYGSAIKMTSKEVALVAKMLQRYKKEFTKDKEVHLIQLQRASASPVDFLASLK